MYNTIGNGSSPVSRTRKERKVSLIFRHCEEQQHCAGIESVVVSPHSQRLFSASRDSTIKRWSIVHSTPVFEASFEGHTDWVNDIVLINDYLVSCSNDRTVRIWKANGSGDSQKVALQHSDYVTCLAAASHKSMVLAAGLRGEVSLIDVSTLQNFQILPRARQSGVANEAEQPAKQHGSVYTLAVNPSGTVIAAGTTDHLIRLIDPRSGMKIAKLRGHTDNVRSVVLKADASTIISGSSDKTIKLWDIGTQRCIQTYKVHSDSVWSLIASDDMSTVLSGGRDGLIYRTQLHNRLAEVVATEQHPIRKLAYSSMDNTVWAATASSSIHCWELQKKLPSSSSLKLERKSSNAVRVVPQTSSPRRPVPQEISTPTRESFTRSPGTPEAPLRTLPLACIRGVPGIVLHKVLPDRRRILTRDVEGGIALWDVMVGTTIEHYGKVDINKKEEELFEPKAVPSWFTADTRLGCLTITLEPPTCFLAEEYAVDLGYSSVSDDFKVNYGKLVLDGAFAKWRLAMAHRAQLHQPPQMGLEPLPPLEDNTRVYPEMWPQYWRTRIRPSVVCQSHTSWTWRKDITQFTGNEAEPEDIPAWVADAVLNRVNVTPRENKCAFILQPAEGSNLPSLLQSKLNAPKILQVHKVAHYVSSKLQEMNYNVEVRPMYPQEMLSSRPARLSSSSIRSNADEAGSNLLELTCNGVAVPHDLSLAGVRKYIWKRSEDVVFNYRIGDPNKPAPMAHLSYNS